MLRVALLVSFFALAMLCVAAELHGFRKSAWFEEQVRDQWVSDGVRVVAKAAGNFDPRTPTRLVIFATSNGNAVEQPLGCTSTAGVER